MNRLRNSAKRFPTGRVLGRSIGLGTNSQINNCSDTYSIEEYSNSLICRN
ncbi:hypothetical protein LEP1GSC096_4430 [Leptospira interrogans serovar Hebdomadis str. R499]|nr:hypothetical protein LEP1GSC096_4430 [Leptospira interrogans serovar Hebdomadis str. R499]